MIAQQFSSSSQLGSTASLFVNLLEAKSERAGLARSWVIVLCLLLLSISAAAQVHLHPDEMADSAKQCVFCQIAHSAPQVSIVVQLDVALAMTDSLVLTPEPELHSNTELGWHFSRPPPIA